MPLLRRRTLLAASAGSLATLRSQRLWAQSNTIRIGLSAPLSGALEPVGKPAFVGATVARDRLNKMGGVMGRQVELVIKDDRGDAAQAVANMREFSSEGVHQIVGTPMTATAMASTAVLRDLSISLITTGTPDERMTHELFNRNYFNGAENTFTRCNAFAQAMTERFPDITTWTAALMDASIGRDYWERAKHSLKTIYAKNLNKEVRFGQEVFLKLGGNDFKTQISQIMAQDATGLFVVMPGAGGITFYQQAQAFGMDKKYKMISDQGLDIDVVKALKDKTPTTLWVSSYWYPDAYNNIPENVELTKTIVERTGEAPHGFSILSYIGVNAWSQAIAAVGGTDTDKVVEALEGAKLQTPRGPAYFRKEDHQLIGQTTMFNVKPKSSPPGWETNDYIVLDTANLVNPPAPGQAWKL